MGGSNVSHFVESRHATTVVVVAEVVALGFVVVVVGFTVVVEAFAVVVLAALALSIKRLTARVDAGGAL